MFAGRTRTRNYASSSNQVWNRRLARPDRRRLYLCQCATAAEAIAAYIHAKEDPAKGLCIGYDTRFGSKAFARACAEVVAATGIPVKLANAITPTPALSYAVRERGAAGGIMITSSHNPAQWNGVKYKAWYGGSGKPSIIAEIESYLGKPVAQRCQARADRGS